MSIAAINALDKRIAKVEADLKRVTAIEKDLGHLMNALEHMSGSINGLDELGRTQELHLTDALVRIKQIEMHLFPGIDKDIQQVYRITKSDTPPAFNPLDERRPKKD